MTIIAYESYESELTVNSAAFTEVISKAFTTTQDNQEYIINVYCEATSTSTNRVMSIRVMLDGVEGARDDYMVPTAGLPHAFAAFRTANINAGLHALSLEVKSTNASDTITVRRIRVYVMKH